ncbi:caprin-2-like [Ylistrum balloti]|uniref:caprin-2-like n=1 Tax=Ylistrum balloti TaxID=509963 RepID=UPI002905C5D9|nr:caprin-2-like [Ylistrum balloti]
MKLDIQNKITPIHTYVGRHVNVTMHVIYSILYTSTLGLVFAFSSDDVQSILRELQQEHWDETRCQHTVDAILSENSRLLQRMNALERENEMILNRLSTLESVEKRRYDPLNSLLKMKAGIHHNDIVSSSSILSSDTRTNQPVLSDTRTNQSVLSDTRTYQPVNSQIDGPSLNSSLKERQSDFTDKELEKRVGNTENAVGFYAALAPDIALGDQQDVQFDHVYTNMGQGYEPRDGHFTAPVAGLYLLSATVLSAGPTQDDMLLEFVKNGANVGQIYATKSLNEGSRVIVLSLDVGDMVWVRHMTGDPGTVANGSHYSTFSGVLISAFTSTRDL